MKRNNVDAALTPEPEPDLWADHDEPTEDTGKASELIKGRVADPMFAGAHSTGEALRQIRRAGTLSPDDLEQLIELTKGAPPRIGICGDAHYLAIDAWPATGATFIDVVYSTDRIDAYHERLFAATRAVRTQPVPIGITPEWRVPPNYPGYIMHSVSRELWREAREKPRYPAKMIKPKNGSYSLSVNGVRSTRGIRALWAETFPEYAGKKKQVGEWASEIVAHRDEMTYYHGLAEWLGEGGAGIV